MDEDEVSAASSDVEEPDSSEQQPGTSTAAEQQGSRKQDSAVEEDTSDEEAGQVQQEADPLYDPDEDSRNEAWADKQRQGHTSDAQLNCPGCFTTLCLDCQQHQKYHEQFRAVFAYNVIVDKSAPYDPSPKAHGQRRSKRAKTDEVYYKVLCAVCNTEVGVIDEDEVYHFFHVFPSNA